MASNYWLNQPTWFIDGANSTGLASDRNTGVDATHPLLTVAERTRRVGATWLVPQSTTITYLSTPSVSDIELFQSALVGRNSILTIQGARTTVATGTLTGFTVFNRAAGTLNIVADTGLAGGFAPHVGRFMRITSGARAGSAWIIHSSGGATATVSTPMSQLSVVPFPSLSRATPQVGDAYEIYTLPSLSCGDWKFYTATNQPPFTAGYGQVLIQDLELDFGSKASLAKHDTAAGIYTSSSPVYLNRCRVYAHYTYAGFTLWYYQCDHVGDAWVFSGYGARFMAGRHAGQGDVAASTGAAHVLIDFDELFDNVSASIGAYAGGKVLIGTACVFNRGSSDRAVTVQSNSAIAVSQTLDSAGSLWGTGNAGHGITVSEGGRFGYAAGCKPIINSGLGAGREVSLAGLDLLYSGVADQVTNRGASFGLTTDE